MVLTENPNALNSACPTKANKQNIQLEGREREQIRDLLTPTSPGQLEQGGHRSSRDTVLLTSTHRAARNLVAHCTLESALVRTTSRSTVGRNEPFLEVLASSQGGFPGWLCTSAAPIKRLY